MPVAVKIIKPVGELQTPNGPATKPDPMKQAEEKVIWTFTKDPGRSAIANVK